MQGTDMSFVYVALNQVVNGTDLISYPSAATIHSATGCPDSSGAKTINCDTAGFPLAFELLSSLIDFFSCLSRRHCLNLVWRGLQGADCCFCMHLIFLFSLVSLTLLCSGQW
jgi:hypothetical protein